mgnify:CR=1 FL=1
MQNGCGAECCRQPRFPCEANPAAPELCIAASACRYKELAGQHKEIMQHLQHKMDAIAGVTDH